MISTPTVSVLMTTYNREKYITEAIDSVLNSTFKNFELIIVDDGSSDNTVSIALEFQKRDPRIKVYVNSRNLGDYPNRNKAAEYATGKYIKYLDSDDTIKPWGLEYCVHEMEKYPEAAMGISYYNASANSESELLQPAEAIDKHFNSKGFLFVGPSGTIIKRDVFEEYKGFDTRFGVASDNFFNIRTASKYNILLFKRDFFFYRIHPNQERNNEVKYLVYNYNYLKEVLDNIQLPMSSTLIEYHKKKLNKRFGVNLVKYFIKRWSISELNHILKQTKFKVYDLFHGLLV